MFHPNDNPMERGWVGRIDGGRMIHLAAQTLQSLFLNGGTAREHAEYPLAETTLLVPVQYPPTVRVFDGDGSFRFANATAVVGDSVTVQATGPLSAVARVAAVIGAAGAVGGWSALLEWHDPAVGPPVKQGDFGLVLGPTVVTGDELDPGSLACRLRDEARTASGSPDPFEWSDALALAARRTTLRPGDVLAGPPVLILDAVTKGVELEVEAIGTLSCPLA